MLLNQGNGAFSYAGQYAVNADGHDLLAGDFNGDGKLDLAYTNSYIDPIRPYTYIYVMYGNGDGSLRTGPSYTIDSFGYLEAAADFNGDKRADLLVYLAAKNAPGAQPRIATLLAKSTGGFYWSSAVTLPSHDWTFYEEQGVSLLVDFNGDGKLDLPLSFYTTANGAWYLKVLAGEGGGKFSAPQFFPVYPHTGFISTIPLTKGARPSILFQSVQNGQQKWGLLINESK